MGRNWSLRARFLLIATACLLPLLGVTVFSLIQGVSNGREQLLAAQGSTAEVVAQVLASTLDDNERVLTEVGASERTQRLDPVLSGESLDQFKRARPNLYGLFLVDFNGNVVAFSGLDPNPLRADPGFADAVNRALTLGEPGVSGKLTTPDASMIALTVPVHDTNQEDGLPIGAVGSLLSVDRLKDTVLPFARGDTIIGIVGDGEVIAAQGGGLEEGALAEQMAKPMSMAISGSIGAGVYSGPEGEYLAAYAPVPGAGWAVLVTHPAPAAYAPNRMLLERGMLAIVLAAAATLALVLLLGEWIARPLRQLTDQAAAIQAGDFSPKPLPSGGGEIASLGLAFRDMSDQLAAQLHDLELAREAGAAHAEQLRDLNRRTVRMQEDERRRIAGDIHDAVSPLITGALYQARALQMTNGSTPSDELDASLRSVSELLDRATNELHGVIFDLRPPDLDDIGLVAAIEAYVQTIQRTGLSCSLDVIGPSPILTPEVRLSFYRIAQEALHNAVRHAQARHLSVQLEAAPQASGQYALSLTVRDDGRGFDPAAHGRGTGLRGMRERAVLIGASVDVESRPGHGTTVRLRLP